MNKTFIFSLFICLVMFQYACQCGDCPGDRIYVGFYIAPSDTSSIPLKDLDSLRIYRYNKGGAFYPINRLDTLMVFYPNLYYGEADTSLKGPEICFVMDYKITPSYDPKDFEKFDYMLANPQKNVEIRLTQIKTNIEVTKGKCPCNNFVIENCMINDTFNYNVRSFYRLR